MPRGRESSEGPDWEYELKLDGYRAIGFKLNGRVRLMPRNGKNFARRFPNIGLARNKLPDETMVDGEVVALDHAGRPHSTLCKTMAARINHSRFMFSTF